MICFAHSLVAQLASCQLCCLKCVEVVKNKAAYRVYFHLSSSHFESLLQLLAQATFTGRLPGTLLRLALTMLLLKATTVAFIAALVSPASGFGQVVQFDVRYGENCCLWCGQCRSVIASTRYFAFSEGSSLSQSQRAHNPTIRLINKDVRRLHLLSFSRWNGAFLFAVDGS
jgi:hypothetical protein